VKPLIAKLHKYVALSVGVLVALMGLTGSTLVFRNSLDARFHPERRVAIPTGASVSYEKVLAAARLAVPSADSYVINVPGDPTESFNVNVESPEGRRMFIDPYSGQLISNTAEAEFALDWVVQLHTHLLVGDEGKYFVAGIGGILIFLGVTGVILWWPRKWTGALRIRWRAKRLGLSYDLHRVAGAMFVLFFLINAVTGIILVFSGPMAKFVGTVAGNPPPPVPKLAARTLEAVRLPLDMVVKAAHDAFPSGRARRVIVPRDGLVLVRMHVEGNNHPNGLNRVYVDPYTAVIPLVVPIATASPGLKMFDWLYPLHLGRLFGTVHQVFQVLLGLVPACMLVTGLIVWQARRNARKTRAAPQHRGNDTVLHLREREKT